MTETPATLRLRAKAAEAYADADMATARALELMAAVHGDNDEPVLAVDAQHAADLAYQHALANFAAARGFHETANRLEAEQAKGAA